MQELIAGRMSKAEAAEGLGVTRRTLNRYLRRFLESGPAGLADRRRSNYRKVDPTIETAVVQAKQDGPHRSARFLRDHLGLPPSADTVRRILVKHHLERTSLPPLKPIRRFEAPEPNALWQIDIQGQVRFPLLGDLLLVGVKDDHSRFLLAGRWFFHQYKINIFMVLHEAFRHWGLPQALLSERGPQGWAHPLHAETEYQAWLRRVGIQPRYGRRARTKGKLENTFRFAQRDFVREHLDVATLETLNGAWGEWMAWQHSHKGVKPRVSGRPVYALAPPPDPGGARAPPDPRGAPQSVADGAHHLLRPGLPRSGLLHRPAGLDHPERRSADHRVQPGGHRGLPGQNRLPRNAPAGQLRCGTLGQLRCGLTCALFLDRACAR